MKLGGIPEKDNVQPYFIDDSMVEHGCCWDTAIVRRCEIGGGAYGGAIELICECNSDRAKVICDALNATLDVSD